VNSLVASDQEAAAVAVAPRVTLKDIEENIKDRFDFTADQALLCLQIGSGDQLTAVENLSICLLVMKNGFTVIGKSAPASPENFNRDLGKKFAYEDAVRQLWPLMGFELRERLHRMTLPPQPPE
jgi:hypothetical protein